MKTFTKLSLVAMAVAALGSSVSFADDPMLRMRLDNERAAAARMPASTTVAVYARRHGVSRMTTTEREWTGSHFELRTNAKGQTFGVYAPNK